MVRCISLRGSAERSRERDGGFHLPRRESEKNTVEMHHRSGSATYDPNIERAAGRDAVAPPPGVQSVHT